MCVSTLRLEPVSSTAVMLATGFIRLETAFPKFNIVAILVGGSVAYRYEELGEINAAKDWDGIILVREKVHIANLVNHARHYLCQMLSIVQEESQFLRTPKPTDPQWPNFDGVRFVGRTANGNKKRCENTELGILCPLKDVLEYSIVQRSANIRLGKPCFVNLL
jgi:hypothetical protein